MVTTTSCSHVFMVVMDAQVKRKRQDIAVRPEILGMWSECTGGHDIAK